MSHSLLGEFPLTRPTSRTRTCFTSAIKEKRRMRLLAAYLIVCATAGCRLGENVAEPPPNGRLVTGDMDAGIGDAGDTTPDAAGACTGTADGDGDGITDCAELADDNPFTDPTRFNGLHAIIGDKPFSGTC